MSIAIHKVDDIVKCEIVAHDHDNTSDHLPICLWLRVKISHNKASINQVNGLNTGRVHIPIRWDKVCKDLYKSLLMTELSKLPQLSPDNPSQRAVDDYLTGITAAMHKAAKNASGAPPRLFRPKRYWCPELSKLRNKKRFWWNIWNSCGRPRSGIIFNCYKGAKKMFRKLCRNRANSLIDKSYNELNSLFKDGQMTSFWQKMNRKRNKNVSSSLSSEAFRTHFSGIMTDTKADLTPSQQHVTSQVNIWSMQDAPAAFKYFDDLSVDKAIKSLKRNASAGPDCLSAEHFIFGNIPELRSHLVCLYNIIILNAIVPDSITLGVIIPILKKPMLNPNLPENYRPITIGSIHAKLIEFLLMPVDDVNRHQFGFRKGRGTNIASCLMSETILWYKHSKSPMFICSLDAERCFDSIWHDGLFFKLYYKLPFYNWRFLYYWYKSMSCMIRWGDTYSLPFNVTRGTKQGSVLSPSLFNIFIDDLLNDLSTSPIGAHIGNEIVNSFAYADDVTLMSPTAPGLQDLIDKCYMYAQTWWFNFGIKKTKCMSVNSNLFVSEPKWTLGEKDIESVKHLEILGTIFSTNLSMEAHAQKRMKACRTAMYSMSEQGCCYPGLSSEVKVHLFKTIGQPTLLYGLEALPSNKGDFKSLNSCQASCVKRMLGFQQRTHHSNLLTAVNIQKVESMITRNTETLWRKAFQIDSALRSICALSLSNFIINAKLIPGSIVERLVTAGRSPMKLLLDLSYMPVRSTYSANGIVDSLKYLIMKEQFLKPYSDEYVLATLLVKAF